MSETSINWLPIASAPTDGSAVRLRCLAPLGTCWMTGKGSWSEDQGGQSFGWSGWTFTNFDGSPMWPTEWAVQ